MPKKRVTIEHDTSPTDMLIMLEKIFNSLNVEYDVIENEVSYDFVYEASDTEIEQNSKIF